MAHLVDVDDDVMVERVTRMLRQPRPFIVSIDPPARLAAGAYAGRSLTSLLDQLEARRAEHVRWLATLSQHELARNGEHDEVGEICVSDIAHQWAAHDVSTFARSL